MPKGLIKRFIDNESGQALSEYGALLAFVCLLVVMAFAAQAPYREAVLQAFANIAAQINGLNG